MRFRAGFIPGLFRVVYKINLVVSYEIHIFTPAITIKTTTMYKVTISKPSSARDFTYEYLDYDQAYSMFINSCMRMAEHLAICDGQSCNITLTGQFAQEIKKMSLASVKTPELTF